MRGQIGSAGGIEGKPRIAVIGAGPAGLMAAEVAARGGVQVIVYERMPSAGRKLLLAGRGGLNLTHSEDMTRFVARYGPAQSRLQPVLDRFGPSHMRQWCSELGISTFVGTSGRVFPASFKTSPVLRAWLRRLGELGVELRTRHTWRGWDAEGRLHFATQNGETSAEADATILALGGASWPQLGADGSWVAVLRDIGLATSPLAPANCGFVAGWSELFREKHEGQPLKAVAVNFGDTSARGDVTITRSGLEGTPIYALAPHLRTAIAETGQATLKIALRPDMPAATIEERLKRRRPKDS